MRLSAPGPSGGATALRLPSLRPFPGVDDHIVEPEVTRDEVIGGRRVVASPAKAPHATQHTRLDYVIAAHAAPGFRAASDLITRFDEESDFATDTCLFKEGEDPATGTRYLEEIAFEVVSKQNQGYVAEKARRMHRRGVRRVFAVWVRRQHVCEWSPESETWRVLPGDSEIEDPSLVAPLRVAALLDAAAADDAVAQALITKGNPTIRSREAAAEAKGEARGEAKGTALGKAEGLAEAILEVLAARGVGVSEAQRRHILSLRDVARLGRYLRRASVASSADEVTAEA